MSKGQIGWLFFIVLLVWAVGGIVLWWSFGFDTEKSGQLGDTFGAVNSLFTGLAFAGVVVTIWLQLSEIRQAREDADQAQKSQREQATILKEAARLNALIALAHHAGKSYERAVEVEASGPRREERAMEYDKHIERLSKYFDEDAKAAGRGFAFHEMEKEVSLRPFINIVVDNLQAVATNTSGQFHQSYYIVHLRINNLSDHAVTLTGADALIRMPDGAEHQISFNMHQPVNVNPQSGPIPLSGKSNILPYPPSTMPFVYAASVNVAQGNMYVQKTFAIFSNTDPDEDGTGSQF